MDEHDCLPFKVGQIAESKSFSLGYRSAWFRCKIKEISEKQGYTVHYLEFFDFPDEKVKCTRLYQKPEKSKEIKRQLMVRPCFPPILYENQMPDMSTISEVTVVVDGVWKVGDLVDWFTDDCFWSATVTQILDNNKVQVEFPGPPVGEGMSYEASSKDLRPSLDWSPQHGWRIMGSDSCRLVKPPPVNQHSGDDVLNKSKFEVAIQRLTVSNDEHMPEANMELNEEDSVDYGDDLQSKIKPCLTKEVAKQPLSASNDEHMPDANIELDEEGSVSEKTSSVDSISNSIARDVSETDTTGEESYYFGGSLQRLRSCGSVPLNSMRSDTTIAALFDLEELAVQVKWLKSILRLGSSLSNNVRPSWKCVKSRPTLTPNPK